MTTNEVQAPTIQAARPEWVRMPKPGAVCPWSGLGRSHLYALIGEGKIKTVSLRREGTARGVRLIHLQSVLDLISRDGVATGYPCMQDGHA
jgi:hypothetical protein